jgi:UDP-N-acetylmuramate dehydrogenase
VREKRKKALPAGPNAGSVFKNPPGDHAGRLLEACGLKGLRVGGAEVSGRHANVIVNVGGATAADVRELMARMREAVRDGFGIDLVPEVEDLGRFVTNRGGSPSVESPR